MIGKIFKKYTECNNFEINAEEGATFYAKL